MTIPVSARIEAILFLSARPVSFSKLASLLAISEKEVSAGLAELAMRLNVAESGIQVVIAEKVAELGTNPALAELLTSLTKEESEAELTRPQLETLTIIAYRGPITRPEIEHIRGVNCAVILRNLLTRGLIVEKDSKTRLQSVYTLSTEMLRHLGVNAISELPDYESLHQNAKISQMIDAIMKQEDEEV